MQIEAVNLGQGYAGKRRAGLRRLDGNDELALFGCDYRTALSWLAERLEAGADRVEGSALEQLSLGDIDRLFASLYRAFFGSSIELRQDCLSCAKDFELTLDLEALSRDPEQVLAEVELPGGTQLRAPRLCDLNAGAAGADLVELVTLRRGQDSHATCAEALAGLDPACVETIETECPHCSARQEILFDLPRFFLRCLIRERELLLREVHLLARTYRWSLAEILSLRRDDRHAMVRLATAALAPRDRVQLA